MDIDFRPYLNQTVNWLVASGPRIVVTKPIKQWDIGREFNRRLKQKFDERNIDAPFTNRTLPPGPG